MAPGCLVVDLSTGVGLSLARYMVLQGLQVGHGPSLWRPIHGTPHS